MALRIYVLRNLDTNQFAFPEAMSKPEALYKVSKKWHQGTWIILTSYDREHWTMAKPMYRHYEEVKA